MKKIVAPILLLVFLIHSASGQGLDHRLTDGMKYRLVGPYRGGRSAAVTGVRGQRSVFYMGSTGGGVWKTVDGGQSWKSVSDDFFGGSIGSVAVSEWDPNVVYAGGGEVTVRGNVSHGSGMWKSDDAGKTWHSIGLADSRHVPRIRIHPRNPDLVYAAVLGHLFGPNEERGIFRSGDGGKTWDKILFVSNEAGAVDLAMDPTNPRVLFASFWNVDRTPYSLNSGGPGSGLWKTTDGGENWTELTGLDNGLPGGTLGIIGVTVSPVNPDRIWAIIEAENGGVYRSNDGGENWNRINDERKLRQRAWYYSRIYADTQNEDIVYVLNVRFWRSKDGGKTYERISTPHGDHHDFWIDPDDASRVIIGDDGGAQVSFDAGDSFTPYDNQPTAQFYRVITDNHFPYRIYGGQQDNSTVRIDHTASSRNPRNWESTAGGESAWIAPHPDNPDLVYGGSYDGYLTRMNHATGERRNVNPWPDNPMGHGAEDYTYRFQWNFPIRISRHDPGVVYTGANVLFKSVNEGQTWEAISPDLTRNDPSTLKSSGGLITQDNTSVEYYGTIFVFVEGSDPGVIWTGSDDGLIHLTRDGGAHWTDVTPDRKIMPEWMQINDMVAHPFEPGGLYVAGTRYKSDDFAPYLYRTTDFGEHWEKITQGIDAQHFTRTVEPDPVRRGLLYAGTENGMYVSFDDGKNWQSFQQNLPIVPITDLEIKDQDLVVATQGRAFWILEDLSPLRTEKRTDIGDEATLYASAPTYRRGRSSGVKIRYFFGSKPDSSATTLRILDSEGGIIKSFTSEEKLSLETGLNTFTWNMRYPDAEDFKGRITWAGGITGPRAVPGTYAARLITGEDSVSVSFDILKDPRSSSTRSDMQEQFDFLIGVRDKLSDVHKAVRRIRSMREAVGGVKARIPDGHELADSIRSATKPILEEIKEIEEALYQTKNRSGQDPLNFPIRLNDKLAGVASNASSGDYRPTDQAYTVRDLLIEQIDGWLERLSRVESEAIPSFNNLVANARIPAVSIKD